MSRTHPDREQSTVMMPVSNVEQRDGPLVLGDCLCPVCLEMFLEPVTLPCSHTFCKSCFLESVDKATLCCPMCRKRVSTWARLNSRNNTLVNEALWTQIQNAFPQQCQRRLRGLDAVTEGDLEFSLCFPRVSQPGELRREYQDQITKLTEEKRELDEAERRASEEYIQRLLAEEEEQLLQERRRREEDERMARMLSQQLNAADVTPAKKQEKVGQIERFLCRLPSRTSPPDSNKENVIQDLPPQLDFYGEEKPHLNARECLSHRSELTTSPALLSTEDPPQVSTSSKRRSSERETTEEEEEEEMVRKRACCSSSSSSSEPREVALQGIFEWEAELQSRSRQEEEDRQVAVLLQKELDQEEKQRATDRRKGSTDAYLLRRHRRGKTSSSPVAGTSSRATKTSTPPYPAAPMNTQKSPGTSGGSRQPTLTDMFSTMSS